MAARDPAEWCLQFASPYSLLVPLVSRYWRAAAVLQVQRPARPSGFRCAAPAPRSADPRFQPGRRVQRLIRNTVSIRFTNSGENLRRTAPIPDVVQSLQRRARGVPRDRFKSEARSQRSRISRAPKLLVEKSVTVQSSPYCYPPAVARPRPDAHQQARHAGAPPSRSHRTAPARGRSIPSSPTFSFCWVSIGGVSRCPK